LYINGEKMTNIVIPDGITTINSYTFGGCKALVSITLPDSVTTIKSGAFRSCTSLTTINIPNNVTQIGWYSDWSSDDGAFAFCSSLTKIEIPDSVVMIGSSTFAYCTSLTNLKIPSNVTKIGSYAFSNCKNLTKVNIPDSVIEIGAYAFESCTSLTSIEIPDSMINIGNHCAFDGCTSLASIVIPDSVTSINLGTFDDCSRLKKVYYGGDATAWDNIAIDNYCDYNNSLYRAVRYYYSETQPTEEGYYWHYVDGVPTVWEIAPAYSQGLEFTLNSDRQSYSVSKGTCTDTDIIIPATYEGLPVTKIGDSAFYNCKELTSISIPDSVTSIGDDAFEGCTSLKTVYYTGSSEEWGQISIGSSNSKLTSATRYYYSETQPTDTTYQYWHYVNGVPTKW
jgi:hypothetical protein